MINKNLPNLITFSRIIGVASLFLLVPFNNELNQLWVIILFILISATDFVDGWLARKFNIVSDLGKIIDPLADKILILIFLPLLSMNIISAFPVFIILAREFSIMGLRVIAAKKDIIIAANISGKLKTTLTITLIGLLLAKPETLPSTIPILFIPFKIIKDWIQMWPEIIFDYLIWITVIITIWSFLDYLIKFLWFTQLKSNKNNQTKTKSYFLSFIPNTISILNLTMGALSIYYAIKFNIIFASSFILIGLICDGLDGLIARKLKLISKMGTSIDSRADIVTFGVAPSVLLYQLFSDILFFNIQLASITMSIYFFSCVFFRLRRFEQLGHKPLFIGLPSPVAATCICGLTLSQINFNLIIISLSTILIGILMITKIKFPHHSHKKNHPLIKAIKIPTLITLSLIIMNNFFKLNLNQFFIIELLLIFIIIYTLSPLLTFQKA
tara:strand:- start:618 stop:1943 length:1326 start_codon:yes stop_codon:yes gene_type:complete